MPLIESVNNDTTTFRSFKMVHRKDVIEVTFDISDAAKIRYESGLITFDEMKAHLQVNIKMTEDYIGFKQIMRILEA